MDDNRKLLLNVPVDVYQPGDFMKKVENDLHNGCLKTIFAVNPEKIMAAKRDHQLLKALLEADALIPDGIGVIIGLRLIHGVSVARITGIGTMKNLLELSDKNNYRIFIFGSKPRVNAKASEIITRKYPGLKLVGTQHGYIFEDKYEDLVEKINLQNPDILFVGLGSPKQEKWIHLHKKYLKVKICMGIGGSLDVISRRVSSAPLLLQQIGFEWLYRLVREPSRFKRQMALPRFIARLVKEKLSS